MIIHLLSRNRINFHKIGAVFIFLLCSLLGYPFMLAQQLIFNKRTRRINFDKYPPVFIIGYFRSGTTHLHNLMARDKEFATPNNYHGLFLNYCLIGGGWLKRNLGRFFPAQRIQDNVFLSIDEPQEEEQAMFCYTRHNGLIHYFFPKNESYFHRYILLNEGQRSNELWRKNYLELLQIISYSLGSKKLLLKNPLNTSRIGEIRKLFPNSNFIFIIRNPYELYSSVLYWHKSLIQSLSLQKLSDAELEELILFRFKSIMLKYLDLRKFLPKDRLIEVKFENLEEDPIRVIGNIYRKLSLEGIDNILPGIQSYLDGIKGYEKNLYPPLSSKTIQRINQEWKFAFREWDYPLLKA